jgi:protoporphyrinogen/coproporphyrinogen III oxidase
MTRVVIIGGGIAGLAAAYQLQTRARAAHLPLDFRLIDGAPVFGGKIVSSRIEGFVVEGGPDSFLTQKTAALDLCRALGLGDELIPTNDAARKIFLWSRGKLRPMPDGVMLIVPTRVMPFLSSSLISWRGKLRMGLEVLIPPGGGDDDESLAHFVRRRLGREALDQIAEPMLAGIYVADAETLSVRSTFPRLLALEKKHGSLIRGMRSLASKSKGSASTFMTLRGGLQTLVEALVDQLDPHALLPGRRVVALARDASGYHLTLNDGAIVHADALVLATPASTSAELLQALDPALAAALRAIRYVSSATVSLGFRRAELNHPLNGFGFLVPSHERRNITGCTWTSTKFEQRAPPGHALLRAFVGGAYDEQVAEEADEALVRIVRAELRALMGISAAPVLSKVFRWPKANPQYTVGHQARVAAIERLAAQHSGLYLAGAAYHGVGIPDCIEDGTRAAKQILEPLEQFSDSQPLVISHAHV